MTSGRRNVIAGCAGWSGGARCVWAALAAWCGVSWAGVASAQPVPLPPLSSTALAAGARVTHEPGPGGGFEFVTIGNQGGVGNPAVPDEYQTFPTPTPGLGRVDYEYRISRTEVTYGQYFDFVRAYAPYWNQDDFYLTEFLGIGIRAVPGGDRHDPNTYVVRPGWENAPAGMGWRFAARFCNWLQNDRGVSLDAFQSGAYDATTFTPDPPAGGLNDNAFRLPGARFFLPTQNEWMKAMYYDPNRFGPGLEGYWEYPTTSNLPPVIGLPGMPDAQTNTNLGFTNPPYPIVSYPTATSSWGLLDGSGGSREWLEGRRPLDTFSRFFRGTQQFGDSVFDDHIGFGNSGRASVDNPLIGVRIAAVIPAPSMLPVLVWLGVFASRRTR